MTILLVILFSYFLPMDAVSVKYLAAVLSMSMGAVFPAIAEGRIAVQALETMGRNPEVSDKVFTSMIVAMAIIESIAIYCLVIALILLFVV